MSPSRKLLVCLVWLSIVAAARTYAEPPQAPAPKEKEGGTGAEKDRDKGPAVTPPVTAASVASPISLPTTAPTTVPTPNPVNRQAPTTAAPTPVAGESAVPRPGAPAEASTTATGTTGTAATDTAVAPSKLPPSPSGTPAEREKWLQARIDEILTRPALGGARVGVAVADVDSGRVLFARNDGTALNPASNTKLVTTAAALALLGPEYRFKTVLVAESGVRGGAIEGNLWLKGHGDPSLVSEDLWKLAADLTSMGVKRINGAIVLDDSFFDGERLGPAFDQKQEDRAYRAPNGAVSLNYNACSVLVLPGRGDGAPARVVVEPASPYFTVVSTAKTTAGGRTSVSISTVEVPGHTEVRVSGTIRAGAEGVREHRRIAHPDLYAGYTLRELLVRRGVKVAGGVQTGTAPVGARVLVSHYSQPLGVIVREVNKLSNNFMAEQVLKTLGAEVGGRPGTWQKGVEAVERYLETLGVPRGRYKMTNGSGLYDANRFTSTQLVTILRAAYRDFRYAADFVASLAVAGADGTIGHRMEGGRAERYVRAKTGTLDGVTCLSGYAGAPGHLPLAFAILMNDVPEGGAREARRAQDAIAEALVAYLQADAAGGHRP